ERAVGRRDRAGRDLRPRRRDDAGRDRYRLARCQPALGRDDAGREHPLLGGPYQFGAQVQADHVRGTRVDTRPRGVSATADRLLEIVDAVEYAPGDACLEDRTTGAIAQVDPVFV